MLTFANISYFRLSLVDSTQRQLFVNLTQNPVVGQFEINGFLYSSCGGRKIAIECLEKGGGPEEGEMRTVLWSALAVVFILVLLIPAISCTNMLPKVVHVTVTPATNSAPKPTQTQRIVITYSATTMTQIGTVYSAEIPDNGDVYLVLDMTIQNQGYDSFLLDPGNCLVWVQQVRYYTAEIRLEGMLSPATVPDGGTVSGKIAFEVPSSSLSNTGFQPTYINAPKYTIQWVRQ